LKIPEVVYDHPNLIGGVLGAALGVVVALVIVWVL